MAHSHHHHHHSHSHSHSEDQHSDSSKKNIKKAFWINLVFTVIEIVGGIYTNSLAILSDAVHDLGDSMSLGMAWYFEKYAGKQRDEKYSYGYRRYSLLSATINSLILCVGSIFLLTQAIPRLLNPQESNAQGMVVLAILGVIANGYALLGLRKSESMNARTVYLHLLEDVLGWVAVLIGALIMWWKDWPIIDPILSVAIALFILYNVYKNLRNGIRIFLQGVPKWISIKAIESAIRSFPFVHDLHDLHCWSLDGNYHVVTVHIELEKPHTMDELTRFRKEIMQALAEEKISHATIEFELSGDGCEFEDC